MARRVPRQWLHPSKVPALLPTMSRSAFYPEQRGNFRPNAYSRVGTYSAHLRQYFRAEPLRLPIIALRVHSSPDARPILPLLLGSLRRTSDRATGADTVGFACKVLRRVECLLGEAQLCPCGARAE